MKEFVKKLISRLKAGKDAEKYNNDFCEWKIDGVYLMCQHKTELFISCLEEKKYRFKYCPVCGKKIKVGDV